MQLIYSFNRELVLHLICLEYLDSKDRKNIDDEDFNDELPFNDSKDICTEIIDCFLNKESPFCFKKGFVWQGEPGKSEKGNPDLQGDLLNASMTHLGCLEVIKIDKNENPAKVDFIPFDDIRGIIFASQSLFRLAKIFYDILIQFWFYPA